MRSREECHYPRGLAWPVNGPKVRALQGLAARIDYVDVFAHALRALHDEVPEPSTEELIVRIARARRPNERLQPR